VLCCLRTYKLSLDGVQIESRIKLGIFMKNTNLLGLALSVLLTSTVAFAMDDVQPRQLRLGYGLQEQSNQGRAARMFTEEVAKLSGGKIKVRPMGASAVGSDVQMQQALIDGTLEMMVGSTSTLVTITKEMALWDTPFLVSNGKEADLLLDGPVGERVKAKLYDKGLVGLVYWENGFRNLTNNVRPIERMEDLNGVKVRVMQNAVFMESFKILGASPVPLAFSDLFTAMEKTTVDGQENPYNTILSSKFYQVQKYLTITNHVYSPWLMSVSRKYWDTLSATERNILTKAAKASRDFERKDTRDEAAKALTELKAIGMKVNELSFSESTRMRNKLTRVYALIGSNVGMDLMIETQNELMKARAGKKL